MSDLLADFERECREADVAPTAALKAGGVHPSLWAKWLSGNRGPTLNNFEAAKRGLHTVIERRRRAHGPGDEAAA